MYISSLHLLNDWSRSLSEIKLYARLCSMVRVNRSIIPIDEDARVSLLDLQPHLKHLTLNQELSGMN